MTQPASRPVLDIQAQANNLQHQATNPDLPVWVGASAGSGKTKVLVERLLRLMLPAGNRPGVDPSRILCITFTKAGASEVMERVVDRYLRKWAVTDDATLKKDLSDLLAAAPTDAQMKRARSLFARVIEAPGGMKIMTIHAFCQSVLARFPMEAGLPAGFEVMVETESAALMRDVRRGIITRLSAEKPEDKQLSLAFDLISAIRNAEQIESLMERMAGERARLRALVESHGDMDHLCNAVDKTLGVAANAAASDMIADFLEKIPAEGLRMIAPRLAACATATNKETAQILADMLSVTDHAPFLEDYKAIFLTAKNEPRKLVGICKDDAEIQSLFAAESIRLIRLDTSLRNLGTANATKALLRFSLAVLADYELEKRKRNRLDFEDLIDRTRRLLSNGGVNWVQYKLDGGLDHILVDEAQDTNPDQWDIISALYDEFYAGTGMREDMTRTTFVVGDEKQSIFSFQRADPRVFGAQHERLENVTRQAQLPLQTIPMQISFRSAPSILRVVDEVFATPGMHEGVVQRDEPIHHTAFKSGKAGRVELWPLLKKSARTEREAWSLPLPSADEIEDPIATLSTRVAEKIKSLLGEKLESAGRLIEPGDIMILVARRKPMAEALLKALRAHDIPVTGIDRMVVTKQLAVRDCLAAMAFVLQPDDDLNLAALLKSPFIGMDEDTLFALCDGRGARPLWQVVKEKSFAGAWLSGLLAIDGSIGKFLHHLLFKPCPADNHSGMRAILARLGDDVRDPVQELLARADRFDLTDRRGLQGFLQEALNDESQIKRALSESDNRVRLMTVHGSKGLEAPIVFMPDTIRATASRTIRDAVLWPDRAQEKDGLGVPLWAPSSELAADIYRNRMDEIKTRGDEEYRRLLYVSLTRAAERLYIGGAAGIDDGKIDKGNSWYYGIERAMQAIATDHEGTLVVENRQTDPVKTDTREKREETRVAFEQWMTTPAPATESPPRPLMPSRPETDEPAANSPLLGDLSYRYRRGRIIHTLFQFLPDLPVDQREIRALEWLKQAAHSLRVDEQNEIFESTFNVLNNPAFAKVFTADGRAEVPLTGLLPRGDGHTIVSGQIDRLVVTESEVTVLDYKTNRPAPKKLEDVPEAYLAQLRTYRDLLALIWPEKPVKCALVWTDGPALMDVTGAL